MPNKPSWRHSILGIGTLVALGLATWGVQAWRTPPPALPATALRAELTLSDGVLYRRDSQPFTGLLVEDWKPGVRRTEVAIADGRAHGLTRGWYESGQLETEEHFVRGVSHGTRTRWYENGAKKSSVEIRDGKLSGVFREWHPNGRLARETPLSDGVPHGEIRGWDAEGHPTATALVDHGQRVSRN